MPTQSETEQQTSRILAAYERLGTIAGTARAVNADRATVRKRIKEAGLYDNKPLFAGRVAPFEQTTRPLPSSGIKRYLLTCAQSNTKVNQRVWDNFLVLGEHYDAEVMVATFTYNRASYSSKTTKRGRGPSASDRQEVWYDPEIEEYICDDQVELAPGLVWCGEMNILPTAVRPLSGLEVYTERKSGIFPHVKVQMQSIASGKHESTKFNFTTGTVTKRNYIQKKEGLKADFHHQYGGLLVEVDPEGRWFVRQVTADPKGVLCDLDMRVGTDGEVTTGNEVEAITWGDIHEATLDPEVAELAWGDGGMMEVLHPRHQFMHDIFDGRARNLHVIRRCDIHERFKSYTQGHDSVEKEIEEVARFLVHTRRDWCKTVVVNSNHDDFMMQWLSQIDYRDDPINAVYFLRCQLHLYTSIADDPDASTNLLRWAIEQINGVDDHVRFLDEDESFVVKGVEYGIHGHRGPNGARGTSTNLARMGRRINRGHEHSAGIFENIFTSGLSGVNDQGYNKGPSSWSPSHIVTYSNGSRAIFTMWQGKWRA